MNRCLHITIHEGSAAARRRATAGLPGRNGNDPGADYVMLRPDDPAPDYVMPRPDDPAADYVMPRPDDPAADYVMPRPDDPAPDYVMPRPDDPRSNVFPSDGSGGWGTVAATACSCCAPAGRHMAAPGPPPPHPFIGPRDYSGFVIVRMAPGIEGITATNLWKLADELKLVGLKTVLELPPAGPLASRPLVELRGNMEEMVESVDADAAYQAQSRQQLLEQIHDLERRTASTAFPPLHSLTSYWRLDLREQPDLVETIVARLNGLAEVGLAYRELAANDPANGRVFSEDQGYLGDAPIGISASWARNSVPSIPSLEAQKLTLCDLEQGWNLDHQDLEDLTDQDDNPLLVGPLFGFNRAKHDKKSGDHGTAVLGQLAAAGKSPFGVKGAAAGFGRFVLASHYHDDGSNGHVSAAILQALKPTATPSQTLPAPLQPGDILLIEVQRGRLPAEVDEADFNAIRLAAGLGIIVIEAAGNGGFDLDAYSDPNTGRSLRRGDPRFRDSGAILVGAARAGLPHDRAPFSNYGSRLDCFGWGEAVTTCGYGDLAGTGPTDSYTNSFSGTSSASPIIAGAAALLQILHHTHTGKRLEPQAMRELLADPVAGTRQGPNVAGNIGVMPNLKTIVRDQLQLVPDIYLRRSIGDDGAPPAPGEEISSSPDILVEPKGLKKTSDRWGEGSRGENDPAPGHPIAAGGQNNLYVRLRNRGLGQGKAHVQLFASPAATLITPERWIPINEPKRDIGPIPQGDTLFMAEPAHWKPPSLASLPSLGREPDPPWSFLAVLAQSDEEPAPLGSPFLDRAVGLPPGPPYFDWAEYRAFLRGPGVAWRNTHRVPEVVKSPATLSFSIAGTPDRARHFDFEVIRRLPAGAKVSINLHPALTAKLRQRPPWLGERSEPFSLPERPRAAIRRVELAAGTYAPATFTVEPGTAPLQAGHSLALRQLWRGEEVGRITWFFGLPAK